MKLEKTKGSCNTAYQMYCSRKEEELKQAAGDLNKCLGIAFEFWSASLRITSDLSMQLEHICQFTDMYGKIMPEKEHILYQELHQKVLEAYKSANLVSSQRELQMTGLMQKVFSEQQNGKDFFGGENAYENMCVLWDSGELLEKLKEFIFIDETAGIGGADYILQKLGWM